MLYELTIVPSGGCEEEYGACLIIEALDEDDLEEKFDIWVSYGYDPKGKYGCGTRPDSIEKIWGSRVRVDQGGVCIVPCMHN